MKIAVMGTGYVGLVTGVCLAELGNEVVCVDIDTEKVAKLQKGILPFYEPGLKELLERNIAESRLAFTTDAATAIQISEVVFSAVGTPEGADHRADLSAVFQVAKTFAGNLSGYKVFVTKSTVPVGTNAKIKEIILECRKDRQDFDVVSNPEFLREGEAVNDFLIPDRIVVGCENGRAKAIMEHIYKGIARTDHPILFTDISSAEIIKYAANAMLATRISFMNEVASLCEKTGADIKLVAQGMGLDKRIGPRFLQAGIGYGGSCLTENEIVIIKKDGNISPLPIKDLLNKEYIGSQILSFDMKSNKITFKPIIKVGKRRYNGNIVNIKTRMNKLLSCTEDHPFIVYKDNKFTLKLANELVLSDTLPSFTNMPVSNGEYTIDVISTLQKGKFDFKKIRVRPINKHFKDIRNKLNFKASRKLDILRSNCMNLEEYLKIEQKPGNEISRKDIVLFTSKGNTTYCPAVILVDGDFCRFLGYYISEGNIHYEQCLRGVRARINIHFNINEEEYVNDLKNILKKYLVRYQLYEKKNNSTISFVFSSAILSFILDDYLGCGKDSYDADIPDLIFSLDSIKKREFLKALFRGDGHIAFPKNTHSVVYDYGSISYDVIHKSILLLSSIGVVPSYKKSISKKSSDYAHFFKISTKKQIELLNDFKDKKTQEKIERVLHNCKDIKPVGFKRVNSDFCVVDIRELKKEYRETDVYSIEVKDTNTFITSHGLIVHNCFPKDVKAFIATAAEHGIPFRILATVDEVNEQQKQSVLPRLKTLVPHLQGAVIALWGLAFKPKTDDMREAPSIIILRQLLQEGAHIRAFDPEAAASAKRIFPGDGIYYAKDPYDAAQGADAVILVTEWNEFRALDVGKVKSLMRQPNMVDGRNVFDPGDMKRAGFRYVGIGR